MGRIAALLCVVLVIAATIPSIVSGQGGNATAVALPPCSSLWSLPQTKLKDHTIFRFADHYYIASTHIDLPAKDERGEYTFAYARTRDFCTWEDLGTVLDPGRAGDADEAYLWAPFVVEEDGVFVMFYTGVNRNIAQSIMIATTTDPSDPQSWKKQGVVFRPDHPGMDYGGPAVWSDARDPMVLKHNGRYYLYYTGRDLSGGIVGVATAETLLGPWRDLGPVLSTLSSTIPESPFVISNGNYFYLYYNGSGPGGSGEWWQWAPSPFGPWQPPVREPLGWAHEFIRLDDDWHATFVVGNGAAVGVARLSWGFQTVPTPQIGRRIALPFAANDTAVVPQSP